MNTNGPVARLTQRGATGKQALQRERGVVNVFHRYPTTTKKKTRKMSQHADQQPDKYTRRWYEERV